MAVVCVFFLSIFRGSCIKALLLIPSGFRISSASVGIFVVSQLFSVNILERLLFIWMEGSKPGTPILEIYFPFQFISCIWLGC